MSTTHENVVLPNTQILNACRYVEAGSTCAVGGDALDLCTKTMTERGQWYCFANRVFTDVTWVYSMAKVVRHDYASIVAQSLRDATLSEYVRDLIVHAKLHVEILPYMFPNRSTDEASTGMHLLQEIGVLARAQDGCWHVPPLIQRAAPAPKSVFASGARPR
jgi:hypothetical protein